jgi:transposase
MAHALQIHPHESIDELRRVVRTSDDEAQKTRIRAIIELREGATRREVARRTVVDSDTITNWIKAYNRGGVAALKMSCIS